MCHKYRIKEYTAAETKKNKQTNKIQTKTKQNENQKHSKNATVWI